MALLAASSEGTREVGDDAIDAEPAVTSFSLQEVVKCERILVDLEGVDSEELLYLLLFLRQWMSNAGELSSETHVKVP